jgi:sigma-B regulation protein RsbU (phosphoserine phosphatase)
VLNHVRLGAGQCLADPSRIAQLLGNLVTNAMTYGAPKSAITVSTILDPAFFSLAVHNLGAPIPRDALPGLFDAMTRGTTAGSANRSVGLGRFIVRHIARAHGGEVSVRSTRDAGTTFTVKVPRKQR